MVTRKVFLRPQRSPRRPKTSAPRGRTAEPEEPTPPSPDVEGKQPRSRCRFSLSRLFMLSRPALFAVAAAGASALAVAAFAPRASAQALAAGPAAAASPGQALDLSKASAPRAGSTVEGTVLHVADGRSVCVALGPTPDEWLPLV